jgi:hypothetical protein
MLPSTRAAAPLELFPTSTFKIEQNQQKTEPVRNFPRLLTARSTRSNSSSTQAAALVHTKDVCKQATPLNLRTVSAQLTARKMRSNSSSTFWPLSGPLPAAPKQLYTLNMFLNRQRSSTCAQFLLSLPLAGCGQTAAAHLGLCRDHCQQHPSSCARTPAPASAAGSRLPQQLGGGTVLLDLAGMLQAGAHTLHVLLRCGRRVGG